MKTGWESVHEAHQGHEGGAWVARGAWWGGHSRRRGVPELGALAAVEQPFPQANAVDAAGHVVGQGVAAGSQRELGAAVQHAAAVAGGVDHAVVDLDVQRVGGAVVPGRHQIPGAGGAGRMSLSHCGLPAGQG